MTLLKRFQIFARKSAHGKFGYFFWLTVLIVLLGSVLFNAAGTYYGIMHTPALLNFVGAENVDKVVHLLLWPEALAIVMLFLPKKSFHAGKHMPLFKIYVGIALAHAIIVGMAEWEQVMYIPNLLHALVAIGIAALLFALRVIAMWIFAVAGDLALRFDMM